MDVDGGQLDTPSPSAEKVPKQMMMVVPVEKLEGIDALTMHSVSFLISYSRKVPLQVCQSCTYLQRRAFKIYGTTVTVMGCCIHDHLLQDPSLLVTTVDAVRKVDATKSADDLRKLGILVSDACKVSSSVLSITKMLITLLV